METGRFLFGRRVRTIQLQLGSPLKLVCAEALVAGDSEVNVECRWPTAMKMPTGICASAPSMPSLTRFSTDELRYTSFRPSLRRSSDREHRLASRGSGRALRHRLGH